MGLYPSLRGLCADWVESLCKSPGGLLYPQVTVGTRTIIKQQTLKLLSGFLSAEAVPPTLSCVSPAIYPIQYCDIWYLEPRLHRPAGGDDLAPPLLKTTTTTSTKSPPPPPQPPQQSPPPLALAITQAHLRPKWARAPTLTYRMMTAEEKLDLLISEVKVLQTRQLTLTTTVNGLNTWSHNANNFLAGLNELIKDLTSHIKALEVATSALCHQSPLREEEGRAESLRKDKQHQGVNIVGSPSNMNTLVMGEH